MWRSVLRVGALLAIAAGACNAAQMTLSSDATSSDALTASNNYANTIAQAAQLIAQSQVNTSSPFNPPWSLEQIQDIFPSFIGLNLVGKPLNTSLRHLFQIWDNNAFVSNWIVQMQLECAKIGVVGLTDAAALRTVNLTLGFQEHLVSAATGAMDFWSEQLRNGSWQQWPTNLATPISWTVPIAQKLAAWCATTPSICALVQPIIAEFDNLQDFLSSFGIPADFDDSSVNLALGLLLSQLQQQLPESWSLWSQAPGNADPALFELFTQFAYQPFSDNSDQNSIDPRSYYYLREFLYQAATKAANDGVAPSLMLIPTWLDSISSSDRNYDKHHKMPFLTNNVDGSVVSNSVFGILSSIMMAAPWDGTGTYGSFLSPSLSQLMQNSTALLAWIVDTQILSTRGDVVLLYYPPVANFYFFAARSLKLLESTDIESLFVGVYNDAATARLLMGLRDTLAASLRGQGTQTLLSQAQWITNPDGSSGAVFDEFLGNADTDAAGNPTPLHEDRLYTTAMVANALLASWTMATATAQDAGKAGPVETLEWITGVPETVQSTVQAACAFLDSALVSGELLPSNAFFSGSVKGSTTLPFNYPINHWQYANGTTVPWQSVSWDMIEDELGLSFSGVIPESDYQSMMSAANNPLGVQTPTIFRGYNVDGNAMVFWSSQQMTHAAGMWTLAQCSVLPFNATATANL